MNFTKRNKNEFFSILSCPDEKHLKLRESHTLLRVRFIFNKRKKNSVKKMSGKIQGTNSVITDVDGKERPGMTKTEGKFNSDPSKTDSGFLSGSNLYSEEFLSEEKESCEIFPEGDSKCEESMRFESGIILTESFSNLSLKNSGLNDLSSSKKKVCDDGDVKKKEVERPPWEIYYEQDEDGDT